MQSVEVSARFGLPPNSKRYCGTRPFAGIFKEYLGKGSAKNRKALEKSLATFTAHYSYLKLIADDAELLLGRVHVCNTIH